MIFFKVAMGILLLAVFVYWARFFVIHWKAKEFFCRFLPEDDKAVINYVWHRPVLSADVPWAKMEKTFIQKRNEVLLKFDRERAERLIAAERKMNAAEYLFIILLFLFFLVTKSYSY